MEVEAELEVRRGLSNLVGSKMPVVQMDHGVRRQGIADLLGEDVGVPPYFVNGVADPRARSIPILIQNANPIVHVVPDETPTHRAFEGRIVEGEITDLSDLHGPHISVFEESGREHAEISPLVRPDHRHCHRVHRDDQIRLAELPRHATGPTLDWFPARRTERQGAVGRVGGITLGRSVVHPSLDLRQLFVLQVLGVAEFLDPDISFYEERWHRPPAVPDGGPFFNPLRPPPHLLICPERHGRHAIGRVALHAVLAENGGDVLVVGHRRWIDPEIRRRVEIRLGVGETTIP